MVMCHSMLKATEDLTGIFQCTRYLQHAISLPQATRILSKLCETACRLEEVMYDNTRLFLVFEYLELDLKRYMDTNPALTHNRNLIKVGTLSFCLCKINENLPA